MKKAKVTKYDSKLLSWHTVFRNGISVPLSHVMNPKMKYRQPTRNNDVAYDLLLSDCIDMFCS